MRRVLTALVTALLGASLLTGSPAQAALQLYGVTITRDVPITLADGTILRANVHAPADPATGKPAPGPFPVVVGLTPYGKSMSAGATGGHGGLNPYLIKRGYLGVVVDVPGTGGSQGNSELFGPDETAASVQVIDWAARLPASTGKVGLLGHSYLAIDQLFAAAAVGKGSPLKAIFPMSASADPYRDLFVSGGAINLESSIGLLLAYTGTRTLTPLAERYTDPIDALNLFLRHLAQVGAFEGATLLDVLRDGPRRFDGPYWRERAPVNVLSKIVENDVAVFGVGGMYDVFQRGMPLVYSGLQNAAAGRPVHAPMVAGQRVSPKYQMLFGPWTHGEIGAGANLDELQLRWFDHWLKGIDTGVTGTRTPLRVIEPGGARYEAATYPVDPDTTSRLHLRAGDRLSPQPPAAQEKPDTLVFTGLSNPCGRSIDQFAAGLFSGPAHAAGRTIPCVDERPAIELPKPLELSYTTDPLAGPMRLAGPVGLTVHARSTQRETMFVVRLESVAPDGKAVELSGGALLGSMRATDPAKSWPSMPYHRLTADSRQPVTPGKLTRYDIEVRPVFATLPAGHRLRVTVGTGDVPHLIPPPTTATSLLGGVYEVHHDRAAASWIDLPVVIR
ncbi:hypothetical protein EV193_1011073 [Herbihabitans rhizosphaerae]|uniref:Xaa-Pro dipeptidyl-peptidase C-terminal domain-containing protein n=1 Tax=Herbihabitans rhizosphaerae TaxID=1872711 RepID=A0A4Q7L7B4_9PSEU|nr:CocE/NonD family hydrolase [Herbihabitans rhizosphaerae]RZS45186.1 hypothetical protein EV193_1011073 [Herbihabitans rhizosphaerae]